MGIKEAEFRNDLKNVELSNKMLLDIWKAYLDVDKIDSYMSKEYFEFYEEESIECLIPPEKDISDLGLDRDEFFNSNSFYKLALACGYLNLTMFETAAILDYFDSKGCSLTSCFSGDAGYLVGDLNNLYNDAGELNRKVLLANLLGVYLKPYITNIIISETYKQVSLTISFGILKNCDEKVKLCNLGISFDVNLPIKLFGSSVGTFINEFKSTLFRGGTYKDASYYSIQNFIIATAKHTNNMYNEFLESLTILPIKVLNSLVEGLGVDYFLNLITLSYLDTDVKNFIDRLDFIKVTTEFSKDRLNKELVDISKVIDMKSKNFNTQKAEIDKLELELTDLNKINLNIGCLTAELRSFKDFGYNKSLLEVLNTFNRLCFGKHLENNSLQTKSKLKQKQLIQGLLKHLCGNIGVIINNSVEFKNCNTMYISTLGKGLYYILNHIYVTTVRNIIIEDKAFNYICSNLDVYRKYIKDLTKLLNILGVVSYNNKAIINEVVQKGISLRDDLLKTITCLKPDMTSLGAELKTLTLSKKDIDTRLNTLCNTKGDITLHNYLSLNKINLDKFIEFVRNYLCNEAYKRVQSLSPNYTESKGIYDCIAWH